MKCMIGLIAAASLSGAAMAGGSWSEAGDAGQSLADAQLVSGVGGLATITGSTGGDDFVDLYQIVINDVDAFIASTAGDQGGFGGSASYDTKLFLFDASGLGVVANDDFDGFPFHSELTGTPDDGSGLPGLVSGGVYYLGISAFGVDAISASGNIFDIADFDEISGADGPGGLDPLSDWDIGFAGQGEYEIALQGVSFVPGPGALALFGLAGLAGRRRRQA